MKKIIDNRKAIIYFILVLTILSIGILFISNVSAQDIFKSNQYIDYKKPCINNGTYCSGTAQCNLTIIEPNSTILLNNVKMTNQIAFHNYTIPQISDIGTYTANMICLDNGLTGSETFEFEITNTGASLSTSQSFMFILVFVIAFIFFVLALIYGLYLPSTNSRDAMTGYIIAVDNKRYLKMFSLCISYLMLMLMFYFAWMISYGYLNFDFLSTLFKFGFYGLAIALLPLFIIGTFVIIANAVRDHKVADGLMRGFRIK